jgi:uncharacterized protein (UPF0264 family)
VDWFDDDAWGRVVNNFGVAAHVAKKGRCKGFMFDTEQYEGVTVFDYRKQKDKETFAEYQAKVRQRGQEWAKAVNKKFPDITILRDCRALEQFTATTSRVRCRDAVD